MGLVGDVVRTAWTGEQIWKCVASLGHTTRSVRISSDLAQGWDDPRSSSLERTFFRGATEAGQSSWIRQIKSRISKEMPYRPVHHVLDAVVILQGGLAGQRQSHRFDEAVVVMIMALSSLVVSCF